MKISEQTSSFIITLMIFIHHVITIAIIIANQNNNRLLIVMIRVIHKNVFFILNETTIFQYDRYNNDTFQ